MSDASGLTAEDIEARFLRARDARAQQRQPERSAEVLESAAAQLAVARCQLSALLETSGRAHEALIAPYAAAAGVGGGAPAVAPADVISRAMSEWRALQQGVQRIVGEVKLPAHDVQTANAALSRRLQQIELARIGKAAPRGVAAADDATATAASDGGARRFRFRRLANAADSGDADADAVPVVVVAAAVAAAPRRVVDVAALSSSTEPCDLAPGTYVVTATSACNLRRSSDCTFFFAPVSGSVFLDSLQRCTIYVGCRQLRMTNCTECNVYVCCNGVVAIEKCTGLRFGALDAWRLFRADVDGGADGSAALARLAAALQAPDAATLRKRLAESHRVVNDFNWLKNSDVQRSPNWAPLPEDQWQRVDGVSLPPEGSPDACTRV
jgi:hypothetical protein